MRVTVIGPNLPRRYSDLGTFHVHRVGCQDILRFPDGADSHDVDAASTMDVVTFIYDPGDFDYDPTDAQQASQYVNDFHWAPCTRDLPQ